jgi:hypothetical protein
MIKSGKFPASLEDILAMAPAQEVEEADEAEPDFENVHDVIQLPIEKRNKRKKKRSKNRDRSQSAAAAVEKAAQNDVIQGKKHGPPPRRNDRPGNNQAGGQGKRPPQNRPEQRPQGDRPKQEQRPPNPQKNQGGGQPNPNRNQGNGPRPPKDKPDNRDKKA